MMRDKTTRRNNWSQQVGIKLLTYDGIAKFSTRHRRRALLSPSHADYQKMQRRSHGADTTSDEFTLITIQMALDSRFLRLRFRWAVCAMDALSGKKERCTLPHHVVPFANKPRAMGHGVAAQNKYTNSLRSAKRTTAAFYIFYFIQMRKSLVCMRARQKKHTPLCDENKQVDSTRFPPLLMHFMLSCMKLHRVRAGFVFYILCFALMGVAFTPSCMRTRERERKRQMMLAFLIRAKCCWRCRKVVVFY